MGVELIVVAAVAVLEGVLVVSSSGNGSIGSVGVAEKVPTVTTILLFKRQLLVLLLLLHLVLRLLL